MDTYYGNYNEIVKLEIKLHKKYAKYNIILKESLNGHKEWFRDKIIKDVIKYIDKLNSNVYIC